MWIKRTYGRSPGGKGERHGETEREREKERELGGERERERRYFLRLFATSLTPPACHTGAKLKSQLKLNFQIFHIHILCNLLFFLSVCLSPFFFFFFLVRTKIQEAHQKEAE